MPSKAFDTGIYYLWVCKVLFLTVSGVLLSQLSSSSISQSYAYCY